MRFIRITSTREFDPEDTLRFYSLRLNEAGLIKSTPDEIIARGTDWRLLEELKQELSLQTYARKHSQVAGRKEREDSEVQRLPSST